MFNVRTFTQCMFHDRLGPLPHILLNEIALNSLRLSFHRFGSRMFQIKSVANTRMCKNRRQIKFAHAESNLIDTDMGNSTCEPCINECFCALFW